MQESLQLNLADYVILGLLAVGLIQGFVRGLSRELARVLGVVAALFVGWRYSPILGDWLIGNSRLEGLSAYLAGFIAAVVATAVVMYGLFLAFRLIMQFSFKGKLERLGGMLAGAIRMLTMVCLVVLAVSLWRIEPLHTHLCQESVIGSAVSGRLMPLYDRLLDSHPEWQLPRPSDEPASPAEALVPIPDVKLEDLPWEHWPAQ